MKKFENGVRWGIIGCGDVTEVKSGPAFQKIKGSTLVSVMRRNGKLAEDYATRHNVQSWTTNAEDLLNNPNIDAIYIATPPGFHMEYTLKAAAAGKAVYVEKPMGLTFRNCVEMIDVCQKFNVPLFVAYYRRALPKFIKIKEWISSGEIGDIRFVSSTQYRPAVESKALENASWRVQPNLSGGGLFFDLASHTLDILDFLLGPIQEAKGFASNQNGRYKAEDIVTGTYLFESGAHGIGAWCFTAGSHIDQNEIIGSKGKISFSTFGNEPIMLTTTTVNEEWKFENPLHIQQPLITTIVDELTGNGKCPSTGKTAARTNWVMDQLVENYYR